MPTPRTRYTEAEAREAVAASRSYAQALRRLGMCSTGGGGRVLRKWVSIWGISTDHFDPHWPRRNHAGHKMRPLEEVLVENSTYSRGMLKRRLYEEGLRTRVCELCGQSEIWLGRRMALILDHVNGIANDNRIENLRIVCPNCAATLDTHCGRNKALRQDRPCVRCGVMFSPRYVEQRHCSFECGSRHERIYRRRSETRKVKRPSHEQLLADLAHMSYVAVGRKYGVSDNAVRKWLRWYERERQAADACEAVRARVSPVRSSSNG